jgi:hypothetical protein
MITITPGMTTGVLIDQIKAAGGLAVVKNNDSVWLIATPPQDDAWDPAMHVLGRAAVTHG